MTYAMAYQRDAAMGLDDIRKSFAVEYYSRMRPWALVSECLRIVILGFVSLRVVFPVAIL